MKTLLIVDDNPIIQSFIKYRYGKTYLVISFSDGLEAFHAIRNLKVIPDLVLADLDMPGMTGFEFTEAIKRSGILKQIPVIILSGKQKSDDRIKAYLSGAEMFLQKPFNPQELDVVIFKTIQKNHKNLIQNQ
ncbi:MAG: response regulator [Candidatus Cyclobacteriaceae bacterium M3_2C_046]